MAVSNTDDHLRNHGFLLLKEGWRLSPVFDVNPDADGDVLSLNVDETNNLIDFELAASVASMYEIPVQQVRTCLLYTSTDVCREMGVRTDIPFRDLTEKEKEIVYHGPAEKMCIRDRCRVLQA